MGTSYGFGLWRTFFLFSLLHSLVVMNLEIIPCKWVWQKVKKFIRCYDVVTVQVVASCQVNMRDIKGYVTAIYDGASVTGNAEWDTVISSSILTEPTY